MFRNGAPLGSVTILPSGHMSTNSNIWEAPCRAMVTREQQLTRGHSVDEKMEEDVRRPVR